eukprot:gene18784-25324_t
MTSDVTMRRLSFSVAPGHDIASITAKLHDISSGLEQVNQDVQQKTDTVKSAAIRHQHLGGGKQSLKRQLQSLKSSLLNLGQKETFSESILGFYEGLDYKSEADRSAGAVEAAEEDLKELKKANEQDQDQLTEAIRMVCSNHDQYQTTMHQVAQRLSTTGVAVQLMQESRAAPEAAKDLSDEEGDDCDLVALLALESERATALEGQIAEAEASCTDLQAALAAEQEHEEQRKIEIRDIEEEKYDELLSIMAMPWSGISDVAVEGDMLRVSLSQRVSSSMDPHQGEEATVEHKLSIYLNPDNGRLTSATLEPLSFDIAPEVECARFIGGGGTLSYLLAAVRGHASKTFALRPAGALDSPIMRAQLPGCGLEAEVDVPFGWPDNGHCLKLVAVEAPERALDCHALLASIRAATPVLNGAAGNTMPLNEFLALVDTIAKAATPVLNGAAGNTMPLNEFLALAATPVLNGAAGNTMPLNEFLALFDTIAKPLNMDTPFFGPIPSYAWESAMEIEVVGWR